jgi:hypothetical protein
MVLGSEALRPTPVPTPIAPMIDCIGKASDTAVNEFSEILATNMESTILYKACMKNDIIIGIAIVISSLPTGIVPSLFSLCVIVLPQCAYFIGKRY